MRKVYENDNFVISPDYKKMSIHELRIEQERLLKEIKASDRPRKKMKSNKSGIVFKF